MGSGTLVVLGGPWEVTNCHVLSVHGSALVTFGRAQVLVGACQVGGVDDATQAAACGIAVLGGSVRVLGSTLCYVGADLLPHKSDDDMSAGMGASSHSSDACDSVRDTDGTGKVGKVQVSAALQGGSTYEGAEKAEAVTGGVREGVGVGHPGGGADEGMVRGAGGWGVHVDLPEGWEVRYRSHDQRPYYVDHNTRTTRWHPYAAHTPVTNSRQAEAEAGADAMEAWGAQGAQGARGVLEARGAEDSQGGGGEGVFEGRAGRSDNAQVELAHLQNQLLRLQAEIRGLELQHLANTAESEALERDSRLGGWQGGGCDGGAWGGEDTERVLAEHVLAECVLLCQPGASRTRSLVYYRPHSGERVLAVCGRCQKVPRCARAQKTQHVDQRGARFLLNLNTSSSSCGRYR